MNIIMGILWIVFAIAAYTQTLTLPEYSALFPRVVIVLIGIIGLLLIINTLIRKKTSLEEEKIEMTKDIFIFQVLVPGGLLFVTYFLLSYIGFYVSSFLLVAVLFYYQIYRSKDRKLTKKILITGVKASLFITGFMYILFTLLLSLPVPQGLLFK